MCLRTSNGQHGKHGAPSYKKEDESEESGTEAQACTWEAGVRPKCSVKSSNRVKSLFEKQERVFLLMK